MKIKITQAVSILLTILSITWASSSNSRSPAKFKASIASNYFNILTFQTTSSTIITGIRYLGQDVLVSNNGQYKLVLQTDYNLVLYKVANNQALWASNTQGVYGIQSVQFQSNGNFVLYGGNGTWWSANVQSSIDPTMFYWVLQDDGNLCRYVTGNNIVASTHTHNGAVSKHFGQIKY